MVVGGTCSKRATTSRVATTRVTVTCTGPNDDEMHSGIVAPATAEWGQQYAESAIRTVYPAAATASAPTSAAQSPGVLRTRGGSSICTPPPRARFTGLSRMHAAQVLRDAVEIVDPEVAGQRLAEQRREPRRELAVASRRAGR